MTLEMMQAKMELKELADVFSNLADVKHGRRNAGRLLLCHAARLCQKGVHARHGGKAESGSFHTRTLRRSHV